MRAALVAGLIASIAIVASHYGGLNPTVESMRRDGDARRRPHGVPPELRIGCRHPRLRWCDVDLDKGRILVPAKPAKARREQTVELHPGVVGALNGARPAIGLPTAPVLPARAVVDFHSLRLAIVS